MPPAPLPRLSRYWLAFILAALPIPALADCTNPTGVQGEIVYNVDYSTMQFCNGTAWISMAASVAAEETDPQVGTLTASKWCASNAGASAIVCDKDAPLLSANNLSDLANAGTARTNLGLGTIATQAASSVTITGGTINGTALGGSTPAAGAFTTLSASGNVAVNTDKFTVTASNGNTAVAGTLAVTGTASAATPSSGTHLATKDYVDTALASSGGGGVPSDFQVFTSSGTWTKPGSGTMAFIECWGGGAGGAAGLAYSGGIGGGAGGYAYVWKTLASLSSTVTVTIGAGGASATAGGNTTFGAYLTANGGTSTAGGGGSGTGVAVKGGGAGEAPGSYIGYGSGYYYASKGGSAANGGGGGAPSPHAYNGSNGTAPGGGGGGGGYNGGSYSGGSGAAGMCVITVY